MRYFFIILYMLVMFQALSSYAIEIQQVKSEHLSALLIEDNSLPIFSASITIKQVGGAYDPVEKQGLSYLTSVMLLEGAGDFQDGKFQELLDFYAINISVSADRDNVNIRVEALSEYQEKVFELIGLMLSSPRFDEVDLQRIKRQHLISLQRIEESASYRTSKAFYQTAFAKHPYSNLLYGTDQSIGNITKEDLHQYHQSSLLKAPVQISVAGNILPDNLQKAISTHLFMLGQNKDVDNKAIDYHPITIPSGPIRIVMPLPQTTVMLALPGVTRNDEMFYAAYVLNHIVGGSGLSSILGQEVRQKRGLTYSIGSQLSMNDAANWFSVRFSTKNDSVNEAVKVVVETLSRVSSQGVTEGQLEAAQQYLTGAFPLHTDSNSELIQYLDTMQHYNLGLDYLDKRNEYIKNVTLQQVNIVAKTLLGAHNHLLVVTGGNK